jgi:hypothetical protein
VLSLRIKANQRLAEPRGIDVEIALDASSRFVAAFRLRAWSIMMSQRTR